MRKDGNVLFITDYELAALLAKSIDPNSAKQFQGYYDPENAPDRNDDFFIQVETKDEALEAIADEPVPEGYACIDTTPIVNPYHRTNTNAILKFVHELEPEKGPCF